MSESGRAGLALKHRLGGRGHMNNDEEKEALNGKGTAEEQDAHVVLPREAQGRIGQHLRRLYGEILAEPLPDKFSKLLSELSKSERSE